MRRRWRILLGRWFTAALAGVAVALISWLWRYEWLPPELWEDVAVAAGLRPPAAPFPLLWHMLVDRVFDWCGPVRTVRYLLLGGHVALGMASALVFQILGETLPSVMYKAARRARWSRWVTRLVMFQGVLLFACADPVWEAGQAFGPTIMQLNIVLLALYIFLRHSVRANSIGIMYWTMFLLGLLSADTPLGMALAAGCLLFCYYKANSNADVRVNPLGDPFVRVVVMRRMTAIAMAGWIAAIAANTAYFLYRDGLAAHDWTGFEFALNYLYNYVKVLRGAAQPAGWILAVVVVVTPLILSLAYVKTATDDDRFLPYWHGVLYAIMGVITFLQVAGWRSFWFWTWTGDAGLAVGSGLLRCIFTSICAQTATYALCVLAVEIYFRNYFRIAGIRFQDSVEETRLGAGMAVSFRRISRVGRRIVLYEPLIFLALLLPWRVQSETREVMSVLHASAWQAAMECRDARYLFTDGALDAAVELCALEQGMNLRTISLMSGSSPRERYIRTRAAEDKEDREMLIMSAVDTLRTWIRLKPQRIKDIALQIGFELWGRGRKPPPCGGLVARPAGFPEGFASAGTDAAHALLDRLLAIYKKDEKLANISPKLREMLSYLQWRLARICRVRADALDMQRKTDESLSESKLADELDAHNTVFMKMRQQMEIVGQGSMRLTPREGLKLGLDRADFQMAEVFARQVLISDPNDVAANFVVGMNYFAAEQYGRAEVYLKKCLGRQSKDSAILNNLAVALMRQDKLDEAEEYARKAVELRPDAPEAKRTLENVQKQKKDLEEERRRNRLMGL